MSDTYKKKINNFNQLAQIERANLSKAESKVISNAQKSMNRPANTSGSSYVTPVKSSIGGTQNNRTNSTNNTNSTSRNTLHQPNSQANSGIRNNNPNDPNYHSDINASRLREEEQQKKRQRERQAELQRQRQRMIELQRQRQKQLQRQRAENQKQLEALLTSSHKLRDVLQEKAKFIQIQYQKQRIYWNEQKIKYQKKIQDQQRKIQEKDKKIQELIQTIAYLKQQLKTALQKIDQQTKIIADLRSENKNFKQQNTIVKLQNKNLKADNKVVITHLDKLLKQQIKQKQKTAKEIFQQRQKRVIQSLYNKTSIANKIQQKPLIYPSDLNQLSNKLKLDKMFQQYTSYRSQANKRIKQLQQKEKYCETEIQTQKTRIRVLQDGLKKVNELRDMQKQTNRKQEKLIREYEKQLSETNVHNQRISDELQRFYKFPRIKQKIGCIVSTPKQFKSRSVYI